MSVVVDTNVPIAANGRATHASTACQLRCVEALQQLISGKTPAVVALDEDGQVMSEYADYLNYHGQPGVGDMFFKYIHDNMYSGSAVVRVSISEIADSRRGFSELPNNDLDKSDRKFLAVAWRSKSRILNALDTDWHEQRDLVASLGVRVDQLCPEHGCVSK